MAAEGVPLSWHWNCGTISTKLDVIWGMSANGNHTMQTLAWSVMTEKGQQNVISETEAEAWLREQLELAQRDEFFFCVNRFLFSAVK